jgi:hypothetical protein
LWNCLTLIGFRAATNAMQTMIIDPRIGQLAKAQGLTVKVYDNRKNLYFFLFYVFFVALTVISVIILKMI